MSLVFIFFIFIFLILFKNRSLALMLVIIQLASVGGSFFMGRFLHIETPDDFVLVLIMILLLFLIVYPWKYYYGIKELIPFDETKLKVLTRSLIVLNSIAFGILLIITIIVQTYVEDINEYKYVTGVGEDFITSHLPFPKVFFSIAIILSNFGYFILPLHFYYLSKKRYILSLICLVLSFNIMLIGLTYFSRAVIVQYMFLYMALLYMHYGIFTQKIKKVIKNIFIAVSVVSTIYFINISVRRFERDASSAKAYSKVIPADAITQDPLTFSYLDYMSQGYLNGFDVLRLYTGEGFNGALTFEKINAMISTPNETYVRELFRQKLWPYEYSYSFTGFPAYAIYDYGILGSILLCLLYFFVVKRMRPKQNKMNLKYVFLIVLIIQVPLMSIFYNQFGESILAFVLWIPLWFYLNLKIKNA